MDNNDTYLPSKKVRDRYSISEMTLWRWERDPKVAFPRPMIVNRRKLYRLTDIEAWERQRAASTSAAA
ncbi:helix-turn-helix transcriptional regulator [Microvirga flavescens]|uniref:helix-turn-helix transcriptional regulator n=1 Tax=Microvirga flavescens TaxID=2249811 RepID=UPI000DD9DD5B|nr:DNA-binding protein [Microvirga flavescens]